MSRERFFITLDQTAPDSPLEYNLWIGDSKPRLSGDVNNEDHPYFGDGNPDILTELNPLIFDLESLGLEKNQVVEVKSIKLLENTILVYGKFSDDAHLYYLINGEEESEHCVGDFERYTYKKIHKSPTSLQLTEIKLKRPALN